MILRRPWIPACAAALSLGVACASGPAAAPIEPVIPPAASLSAAASASSPPVASAPPAGSAPPAASEVAAIPPADEDPEHPLPPGFVHIPEKGEARCGALRVEMMPEPQGDSMMRFVRVSAADGSLLHDFHGAKYKFDPAQPESMQTYVSVEFCGDLTGDGTPEIVLTEATMGAHCCYTHHVFSLSKPVKNLMTWEKGDMGTPLWPARYRPTGAWQIEGRVVFWPPFKADKNSNDPAISYAGAPVIPAVMSLVRGRYTLTSLSFPDAYRLSRDSIHRSCAEKPDECGGELIAWVDSLVIGDWKTERAKPMYKDILSSLDQRAAATRQALLRSLGTEGQPGRLK